MTVQDLLVNLENLAMGTVFQQAIEEFYAGSLQHLDANTIEADYISAKAHFDSVLSNEQITKIQQIEELNSACRAYSAKYGFKCGLYGAFKQYFTQHGDADGGFDSILCVDLLTQPRMQRHHKNYARIVKVQQLTQEVDNTLDPADTSHFVSICCAWNNRIYNASLQGFYCGYRAAYAVIECIEPLGRIQNIDKILSTEYYLGFTHPYAEVERLGNLHPQK